MSTNYYTFLPFLRKGLNTYITEIDKLGTATESSTSLRGSVNIDFDFKRKTVGNDVSEKKESFSFDLVGNVDVKSISPSAVLQTVPLDGTEAYCSDYLPCIEFFEEDLPWRYTPLAADDKKLRPWMALIVCKDGEYSLQNQSDGSQVLKLNLTKKNYNQILPPIDQLHFFAHVQLSTIEQIEVVDNSWLNIFLAQNPEAGLSRIFAPRKLEGLIKNSATRYAAFLIPSFELGRLNGLGEKLEGADTQTGAWAKTFEEQQKRTRNSEFPIYYQWSFSAGGNVFFKLAKKLNPIDKNVLNKLPNSLSADLSNCGIPSCSYSPQSTSAAPVIDVPVACILPNTKLDSSTLRQESDHVRKDLKDLLDLSPVFEENRLIQEGTGQVANMEEDPWVTPPIYGAKHALSTSLDSYHEDWVSQQNLAIRNRASGGLGKKVVQTYQEQFVQRAWLQVERINSLNQQLRERLAIANTERATSKKHVNKKLNKTKQAVKKVGEISGLSTDSFIRTVNLSNQKDLTADNIVLNLEAVNEYDKPNYIQQTGVDEAFMNTLLKAPNDDITELPLYDNAAKVVIFQNEVLNKAYNVKRGNPYESISVNYPLAKAFDGLLKVEYNGLSYNHKTQNITIDDLKHPFEFAFNQGPAFRGSALNNGDVQQILVWLSGFDDLDGYKDYYDEHCDLPNFMEKVRNYNKLHKDYLLRSYEQKEKVSGSNRLLDNILPVPVTTTKNETQNAYLLPDPTFQRIFGTFIKKHNISGGVGVRYTSSETESSVVFFYPVSIITNKKSTCYIRKFPYFSSFLLPQDWYKKYGVSKLQFNGSSFDIEADYHIGMLQSEYVKGSVSKGYDLRNVGDIDRDDHEFVMGKAEDPLKYMSRYKTLKHYERIFEENFNNKPKITIRFFQIGTYVDVSIKGVKGLYFRVFKKGRVELHDTRKGIHQVCFHNAISLGLLEMIDKNTCNLTIKSEDGKTGLLPEIKNAISALDEFASIFYEPEYIEIDEASTTYSAWELVEGPAAVNEIGTSTKNLIDVVKRYAQEWNAFSSTFTPQEPKAPVIEGKDIQSTDLIDASAEAEEKMKKILETYYNGIGMTDQVIIEDLLRSKYPIMVYPEYPDPTYFYLRELSQRFILPSVDKLPDNSISLFKNNTEFVESFLSGMNTEMGRELLWREYPSDERGSYFRKFWDSEEDPTQEAYWDVKYLHEWQGHLGANHADDKKDLLIFAIKGELLQAFPQTFIYLTQIPIEGYTGNSVIMPSMSAWLNNDTYLVGFPTNADQIQEKHYLTFQERDVALHFDNKNSDTITDSASWAKDRVHQPVIWAAPCRDFLIN